MAVRGVPDIPRPVSADPETQRFYDSVRESFKLLNNNALAAGQQSGAGPYSAPSGYGIPGGTSPSAPVQAGFFTAGPGNLLDCAKPITPGSVTGIEASGAFGAIRLSWDYPTFIGYKETEIWVSTTPDRSAAQLEGTKSGTIYSFPVPAVEFVEGNNYEVIRYVWMRHVSVCANTTGMYSEMVTATALPSPTVLGEIFATHANTMLNALGLGEDLNEVMAGARAQVGEARQLADDLDTLGSGVHTSNSVVQDSVTTSTTYMDAYVAELGDSLAGVITRIDASATDAKAEVDYSSGVLAEFNDNIAAVTTTTTARADEDGAYAMHQISTAVETAAGYSAVDVRSEVDDIGARYVVKTDVNGYVQGYGLLNTGTAATSGMSFMVNNFYVTSTVNGTKLTPFSISNGKVYAKDLYVTSAQIESLDASKITSGSISADRIGAGTITANSVTLSSTSGTVKFGTDGGNSTYTALRIDAADATKSALSVHGACGFYDYAYFNSSLNGTYGSFTTGLNTYGNLSVSGTIYGTVNYASSSGSSGSSGVVSNSSSANLVCGPHTAAMQSDGNFVVYKNGVATFASNGNVSDARFKKNIKDSTVDCLTKINSLRVVDYEWAENSPLYGDNTVHTGFISQEVRAVHGTLAGDVSGTMMLNYNQFIPLLTGAVQHLTKEVAAMKARIKTLEEATNA
jgi:hypothetical protein